MSRQIVFTVAISSICTQSTILGRKHQLLLQRLTCSERNKIIDSRANAHLVVASSTLNGATVNRLLILWSSAYEACTETQNKNTARTTQSFFVETQNLLYSVDVSQGEGALSGQLRTVHKNCLLNRESQCLPHRYWTLLIEENWMFFQTFYKYWLADIGKKLASLHNRRQLINYCTAMNTQVFCFSLWILV